MIRPQTLRSGAFLPLVLAFLAGGSSGGEADRPAVLPVDEAAYPYSDQVAKALAELKKRGGPWEIPPGRIDLLKHAADIYGAPPPIARIQAGGDVSVDRIGIRLRKIAPGEFTMGSAPAEPKRRPNEPVRKVRLTKAFSIGMTEVTNRQYLMVVGKTERLSTIQREDLDAPLAGASWKDAMEFCGRLGAMDGRKYRLPTEAEWEYACRAGSSGPFSFPAPEDWLRGRPGPGAGDHLWYVENNHVHKPKPVSLKKPNAWGLFDMHGNVEELCLDVLSDTAPGETLVDPVGPETPGIPWCVVRGGRFRDDLHECRAARRRRELPRDANGFGVGFRVVREE